MRKKIIAANWKMNLTREAGATLVKQIIAGKPALSERVQVVIAPPATQLAQTAELLQGETYMSAAAQNCHQEASGAYTGEISAEMVQDAGAQYVILGHSERREYFGENNALLAKKVTRALGAGLKVIYCCGEVLDVRESGGQDALVGAQVAEGLFHLNEQELGNVVIAYEPVWAIGTGKTATSEQAQEMHQHIRQTVSKQFGAQIADDMSILYGGSCKPSNAAELFACPDVDGGLIGGASLKAEEFLGIIRAMSEKNM